MPKETFWHMVTHFFYDITHFDSNFFITVKDLLFKPGFLTKEYMLGRRKSYLHPVRMYVFTSAVFFLVFFSIYSVHETDFNVSGSKDDLVNRLKEGKEKVLEKMKSKEDSLAALKFYNLIEIDSPGKKKDTANNKGVNLSFDKKVEKFNHVAEYDSVQKTLSASEKDGWFLRAIYRKTISLKEKYQDDQSRLGAIILNKFMHSFPYMLFVSLPLYALFLKLLYVRNKKFYFADHAIFLVHLYIFTFITMLLFIGFSQLKDAVGWGWLGFLQGLLIIYGVWYAYKAMKNFYEQRGRKTFLKYILLNFLCLFSLIILFGLFLFITFFQV